MPAWTKPAPAACTSASTTARRRPARRCGRIGRRTQPARASKSPRRPATARRFGPRTAARFGRTATSTPTSRCATTSTAATGGGLSSAPPRRTASASRRSTTSASTATRRSSARRRQSAGRSITGGAPEKSARTSRATVAGTAACSRPPTHTNASPARTSWTRDWSSRGTARLTSATGSAIRRSGPAAFGTATARPGPAFRRMSTSTNRPTARGASAS